MSAENASQINDLRFKAENEDGVVLECEALLMFDSPFFGKSYIVYTDGGTDEDGHDPAGDAEQLGCSGRRERPAGHDDDRPP